MQMSNSYWPLLAVIGLYLGCVTLPIAALSIANRRKLAGRRLWLALIGIASIGDLGGLHYEREQVRLQMQENIKQCSVPPYCPEAQ